MNIGIHKKFDVKLNQDVAVRYWVGKVMKVKIFRYGEKFDLYYVLPSVCPRTLVKNEFFAYLNFGYDEGMKRVLFHTIENEDMHMLISCSD